MRRIAFLVLFALLSTQAGAVTVSRLYDFQPNTKAEADQVDAELDNIISAINGNLGSSNFLDGSVATADLASYSVTHIKMGPLAQQESSSSEKAQRSSVVEGAVPNLTANITVYSRPVWVGLQSSGGSSSPGSVTFRHGGGGGATATENLAYISFQRNFATRNQAGIGTRSITNTTESMYVSYPCSSFWFLDEPGAGTHNYTAYFRTATQDSGIVTVENCKLVVFEL